MNWLHDAKISGVSLGVDADKIAIDKYDGHPVVIELDTAGQYQLIEYLVGRIREKEARRVDDRLRKILEAR